MKETEKKSIIELLDSMLRGNPVELCGVLASTNLLVDAGFEKVFFNVFYTVSAHSEQDMSQHFYVLTAGGKAKQTDGQAGRRMMWREPLQIADTKGFQL